MDCEKFNEYITEYEARRLTRKQELEFLHHKDVCEECNLVFNLVFQDSEIQNLSYMSIDCDVIVEEYNIPNSMCCSVMEKIQNIEQKKYNFKFYNILNIVFGVIAFGVVFTLLFIKKDDFYLLTNNIFVSTTNTANSVSSGISQVSYSAVNGAHQCAIYLYIVLLFAVALTYLFSKFKIKNK